MRRLAVRGTCALAALALAGAAPLAPTRAALRVCADPNNLPFSDAHGAGFENRVAELVARELGLRLEYAWRAQRRGFVRNTLGEGRCDLVPGVPAAYEQLATTRPYYRSAYAFVTRAGLTPVASFADPRLRDLRIGVHAVGDDYASVPPAIVLARLGIRDNVRGVPLQGDYREPSPPARLTDAVARGELDVAIAWGPLAGDAARRHPGLQVRAVVDEPVTVGIPLAFDVSMGVRADDVALRERVDGALAARADDVAAILRGYGVPLLPLEPGR